MKRQPVMKEMCGTCPFRPGSPYAYLRTDLAAWSISQTSRICHCTGTSAINGRTGKPDQLCRGARNVQLQFFAAIKFIDAPTDAAWDKKCKELGI